MEADSFVYYAVRIAASWCRATHFGYPERAQIYAMESEDPDAFVLMRKLLDQDECVVLMMCYEFDRIARHKEHYVITDESDISESINILVSELGPGFFDRKP